VLQCVAKCCKVLPSVAMCTSEGSLASDSITEWFNVFQCLVVVCCSVLQCDAVCCKVLPSVAMCTSERSLASDSVTECCSALQRVEACCSMLLQCVAVWCSVLQSNAVRCNVHWRRTSCNRNCGLRCSCIAILM